MSTSPETTGVRSAAEPVVRELTERDVPAVVTLFERAFPNHGWRSRVDCEAYFREVFFNHPWRDLELPSLVAEEAGGLSGFYGIIPRPMRFRGRMIRVAVGCNAMVDPARRHGFTALRLLKAQFAGPQDLTLADGATARSLRIWCSLGGHAPLACNMHWTRTLRPAEHMQWHHGQRTALRRALGCAARPFAALVDSAVARLRSNRFLHARSDLVDEPITPAEIAADTARLCGGKALQPAYDERSFAWLFEHAAARESHGTLRARRVRDREGRALGWYVYYARSGGTSEVLQLVAQPGAYERVLDRLLADAWRQGATAVRGRGELDQAQALSARQCWFRWEEPATLVHSRHAEIIDAIQQGDAVLSRFDGEWWLRFQSG